MFRRKGILVVNARRGIQRNLALGASIQCHLVKKFKEIIPPPFGVLKKDCIWTIIRLERKGARVDGGGGGRKKGNCDSFCNYAIDKKLVLGLFIHMYC
jgi:hypothetical protein